MFRRILKKDLQRNKVISAALFLFIFLAALLVASAVSLIGQLLGALDHLFESAQVPHFVQMHAGELEEAEIAAFAAAQESVTEYQVVELLNINGAYLYLGHNESAETNSIIENSFVVQNQRFDYLLDTDNQIITLNEGEVAVPLYHMQQYGLTLGQPVRIVAEGFALELTIAAFARDAQMNPAIITSKRFLLHEADWQALQAGPGEPEYLIEFRLNDESEINVLENAYLDANLPQAGPTVTAPLYRLMNGLTDGIVAAVIILVSLLLLLIAALCLRFTLLATLEEDYREIGVMKAIGIPSKQISRLYLGKYLVLAALACLLGYLLSLPLRRTFQANIQLYLGGSPQTALSTLLPLLGVLLVWAAVVLFCRLVLRRFRRVSALAALRSGSLRQDARLGKHLRLSTSRLPQLNVYLGLREVASRFRFYGLLCFVYLLCIFLMIIPLNLRNTIESPQFIRYMGAGQSDIRIDLQQTGSLQEHYQALADYLLADPDLAQQASFVTASYKVENADGQYENLKVEIGDFSVFPLEYSSGQAPQQEGEIALSALQAEELAKQVGDSLTLLVEDAAQTLTVCGIYQDVTNGGKTAKALLPYDSSNLLWYVVNLNLREGVEIAAKVQEYQAALFPAKVTGMQDYMAQTLGPLAVQLGLAVRLALLLALAVAALITALFFKMLLAKEAAQIAIQRCLGFSLRQLRRQYLTRAWALLVLGLLLGNLLAALLGPGLAGLLITGVDQLQLIVNPWQAYLLCPLLLLVTVSLTLLLASRSLTTNSDLKQIAEQG